MPMPARRMGVNPIFGLILVPVNGAIGVCYSKYRCIRNTGLGTEVHGELTPWNDSSSRSRLASIPNIRLMS